MKKNATIHYIIGTAALLLTLVSIYYIDQRKYSILSLSIIAFAGCFVAISQFLIIKNIKKNNKT